MGAESTRSTQDPHPEQQPASRRRYRSDLREAQAMRTRATVLEAARALFEAHGFGGTTVASIASRSGVSPQTVYATFGSKARVAQAIVEEMEESTDAARLRQRIETEADPAMVLRAVAEWTGAFFSASRPQLAIARELTPDAAEMVTQGNARRREGMAFVIDRLIRDGALRHGLSREEAVDRAWLLTSLHTYLDAVQGCGWDQAAYVEWLAEALTLQVLDAQAD